MIPKQIQGLMFVRKVAGGKTILAAVIDSKDEMQGESQYEFYGTVTEDGNFSIQTTGKIIDLKDRAAGWGIEGLLREPIWRT